MARKKSSDTNIILVTAGRFYLFPWRRGFTESAGFKVCPNVNLDLFVFDSMLSTITQLTGICLQQGNSRKNLK